AIAARIDLHARESQCGELPCDRLAARLDPRNPGRLDFDECNVAVMAHTQIAADAELAQKGLTALHLLQARWSDRQSVLDPAGQAWCGRRVPGWEAELARRFANLSLGEACVSER